MRLWQRNPQSSPAGSPADVPLVWSGVVALVALAVYLLQAPTVSGDKDASEFTLVLALNGVSHPTGYPLYTLFGHVFVQALHALGASWPYAANAWSAVGGGVAIFFLHALAVRLVPAAAPLGRRGRVLVALLPLAFFAFNPMWTVETNLAEVYSWHVAWVCGAAYYFVGFVREVTSGAELPAGRRKRRALEWGFLCGLGGAHHLTAMLVAAPLSICLVLLAWRHRQLRPADPLLVLLAAAVPLLSYGIIAYRAFHPTLMQWPMLTASWPRVIDHITGTPYRQFLGRYSPSAEQRRYLSSYVYPILFPALVVPLVAGWRAREPGVRAVLWTFGVAAIVGTLYTFDYGAFDPSSYFLAPMAVGLVALAPLGAGVGSPRAAVRRAARAGVAVLSLAAAALLVPWMRVAADRRQVCLNFETLVHGMWQSIPSDSAIVFWSDDMYARLHEYQWLRGEKPGIDVEHLFVFANELPQARFKARFGFDPLAGVTLHMGRDGRLVGGDRAIDIFFEELLQNINRHTAVPVITFDPEKQSVRLLKKQGAPGIPRAAADSSAAR